MAFTDLFRFGSRPSLTASAKPIAMRARDRGWYPLVGEPYTGAWQRNDDLTLDTVLNNPVVFACTSLVSQSIGKLRLRLVRKDSNGIWTETTNPAWSPLLRKPNRYQTIVKFVEQWITSKLTAGNAYVLKERDGRGVISALYVLDPHRVKPLVADDGSVYYELGQNVLADLQQNSVIVPAREIIHDPMVCLFHPLIGVSPLYAAGLSAMQGLKIQNNQTMLFSNGSNPGGVLTAPGAIDDDTAKRLKDYWDTNFTGANVGKVAVLGDGLKYDPMVMNAVDSQLIDQLKWTDDMICCCFHVPPAMVNLVPSTWGTNIEPLLQQFYTQCIQSLLANFELSLDEGIELPLEYGTEFDIDDLIWMDTATKTKAAGDTIGSGTLSPDEARKKYFGIGPVPGGDSPFMQQQYFSLAALAERDGDQPFAKPAPGPKADSPDDAAAAEADAIAEAKAVRFLVTKGLRDAA